MDVKGLPEPVGSVTPMFKASPIMAGKLALGSALAIVGLYNVSSGKKAQDVSKMILGAALVLAALLLF